MNTLNTRTIKEMVENKQKVRFRFYRDGQLWYATECGFEFPVPISEAGTATFFAEDKAILFMRYIRKYMEFLKKSMDQQNGLEFNREMTDSSETGI
jgi:hypothetical protein